jgi:hypothetical protein
VKVPCIRNLPISALDISVIVVIIIYVIYSHHFKTKKLKKRFY